MHNTSKALIGGLFGAVLAAQPAAAIDIGANMELDLTADENPASGNMEYTNGGRVEVNFTGRSADGGNFVSGKASAMQGTSGDAFVDDSWIQFGNDTWAVKVGRFEAINLFPLGKDTFITTRSAGGYEANVIRGRLGGDGIAFTTNVGDGIMFELDTAWGEGSLAGADPEDTFVGFRPAVVFGAGDFTITVGAESIDSGAVDVSGTAVTVNTALAGGSLNVNFATADIAGTDQSSTGANFTLDNWGVGVIIDDDDTDDSTTTYAAYSLPLMGVDGATVTFAISAGEDTSGGRVRFNYDFE